MLATAGSLCLNAKLPQVLVSFLGDQKHGHAAARKSTEALADDSPTMLNWHNSSLLVIVKGCMWHKQRGKSSVAQPACLAGLHAGSPGKRRPVMGAVVIRTTLRRGGPLRLPTSPLNQARRGGLVRVSSTLARQMGRPASPDSTRQVGFLLMPKFT